MRKILLSLFIACILASSVSAKVMLSVDAVLADPMMSGIPALIIGIDNIDLLLRYNTFSKDYWGTTNEQKFLTIGGTLYLSKMGLANIGVGARFHSFNSGNPNDATITEIILSGKVPIASNLNVRADATLMSILGGKNGLGNDIKGTAVGGLGGQVSVVIDILGM
jgi:hypothetical protein